MVIAPTFGDKRDPDASDDLTFAMYNGSGASDGLYIWIDESGTPAAARYEDSQAVPADDLRSAAAGVPSRDGLPARASAMLAAARGVAPEPRDEAPENSGPPAWGIGLVGLVVFGALTLTWRQRPALLRGPEDGNRLVAEPPLEDARKAARAALLELQRAVAREDAPRRRSSTPTGRPPRPSTRRDGRSMPPARRRWPRPVAGGWPATSLGRASSTPATAPARGGSPSIATRSPWRCRV